MTQEQFDEAITNETRAYVTDSLVRSQLMLTLLRAYRLTEVAGILEGVVDAFALACKQIDGLGKPASETAS